MNSKIEQKLADAEAALIAISGLTDPAIQHHFGSTFDGALRETAGKEIGEKLTQEEKYEAAFWWMWDHYDTVAGIIFAVSTIANQAQKVIADDTGVTA